MTSEIRKALINHKSALQSLLHLSDKKKTEVLLAYSQALRSKSKDILIENKKDISFAIKKGKNDAFLDRLTLSKEKVIDLASHVEHIAHLEDPIGKIIEEQTLSNGVILSKIAVPLGSICIIYESRPDVTVNVTALCFKTGNGVILKGGSESIYTNRIFIQIFHNILEKHGIYKDIALFIDSSDRKIVSYLLKQDKYIDVVIPRGGYELVRLVKRISRIPVLSHAQGGARIFIDKTANIANAISICVNAKTDRPATCNSLDTILIHEEIAAMTIPLLKKSLEQKGVTIVGDAHTAKYADIEVVNNRVWDEEFLSLKVAIKIVKNAKEALVFIQKHSKGHSEGVITEDASVVNTFISQVDAAALFINCSTRLHDGTIFGMGAEMGISTGKLHARGPVGLKELTTMKWVAKGSGQIRT